MHNSVFVLNVFLQILHFIIFLRWLVYCHDLEGLLQCFELIGDEQHSDFIKVHTPKSHINSCLTRSLFL